MPPYPTNLRLDPFERTGWPDSGTKTGPQTCFHCFVWLATATHPRFKRPCTELV